MYKYFCGIKHCLYRLLVSQTTYIFRLKDPIQKLSAQSFHGVFDYLTKSIHFSSTTKPINSKKFVTTYFGLRLLANAVITIQGKLD